MKRDSTNFTSPSDPDSDRPSVCFVMPKAYGVLTNQEHVCHAGGAEVQQTLIARELVQRGWRVSFVTSDFGQLDGQIHDNIRIYKTCRPESGLRAFRFLHPRLTSLWSALRRANAQVYAQRTAGVETAQVALWCLMNKKPFVFASASKRTCQKQPQHLGSRLDQLAFPFGLRHADAVIVQTREQEDLLLASYGVTSTVIPSCAVAPSLAAGGLNKTGGFPGRFLWIGRLVSVKRFGWLIELAQRLPEITFDVVGDATSDSQEVRAFRDRAKHLRNLLLHGTVPHTEIGSCYQNATALLCTSLDEGFPNTFLEAWSRGVPVMTTVDPDGVVARNRLGLVASKLDQFAANMALLNTNPEFCRRLGQRARRYFQEHHLPERAAKAYEAVLKNVVKQRTKAPTLGRINAAGNKITAGPIHQDREHHLECLS